ncbi:ORF6C domain-containing protein (plasmid) [Lysinibacillus capsici]|uniref:ORF6C domain-containing protein n=1 Tax=Lysinibacillus capsici TaxID=2115968 RepID=UPI0021DB2F09|nr:ORF6C domain-containing protein [Lysinibacillus capsici]UYB50135.1 ORF6C domain-containing protein [Lysinibacillus capsici]UYB50209.1 ORF6C domain-containing protein [Lysinibacillus capsici]
MSILQQEQCCRLRKAVGERVNKLTKVKEAQSTLYRALYSALAEKFNVTSYNQINQKDFFNALHFIYTWK